MKRLFAKIVVIFLLNNFNYLLSLTYDTGFHMDVKYFVSDHFRGGIKKCFVTEV